MAISVFHSGVVLVTNTHTEASPPRSPPREADTVALEEQLKATRLTRIGDPSSPHPIWNGGFWMTNVFQDQPLHLIKYDLQILTDASRSASAHLGEHTARGT